MHELRVLHRAAHLTRCVACACKPCRAWHRQLPAGDWRDTGGQHVLCGSRNTVFAADDLVRTSGECTHDAPFDFAGTSAGRIVLAPCCGSVGCRATIGAAARDALPGHRSTITRQTRQAAVTTANRIELARCISEVE